MTAAKALYSPIGEQEPSPFDDYSGPQARQMTFRIQDRDGTRFDQAAIVNGLSAEIEWLWPGHIPLGRVTVIEGPAGSGKSFVALDLAARLAADRDWPNGTPQSCPGSKALILCRQDDMADVVGARLERWGPSPSGVSSSTNSKRWMRKKPVSKIVRCRFPLTSPRSNGCSTLTKRSG
jgi:AAA domain